MIRSVLLVFALISPGQTDGQTCQITQVQPTVYREIDMEGQAWTDVSWDNLRSWIKRRNQQIVDERAVANAKRLKAEKGRFEENPPTGVIAEMMPDIKGNWYGGAHVEEVIKEAHASHKRAFSLACFGPDAESTVKSWKADPRFEAATNVFGSSLHIQAYTDKDNYAEIEAIAPGITAGLKPGVVLSLIEKDSPLDGKVLWRPKRGPSVDEVIAQLRDKQRPDYDPAKDPGGLGDKFDLDILKTFPLAKLGVVFLGILAIARFRK